MITKLVLLDAGLQVQLHSVFFIVGISFWGSFSNRETLLAASFPLHTLIIFMDGIYWVWWWWKGDDRNMNPNGCRYTPLSHWNFNIKQIYERAFESKCCGINRTCWIVSLLFYTFATSPHSLYPIYSLLSADYITHEESATALLHLGVKGPTHLFHTSHFPVRGPSMDHKITNFSPFGIVHIAQHQLLIHFLELCPV